MAAQDWPPHLAKGMHGTHRLDRPARITVPGTGSADLACACIVDAIDQRTLIWRTPERSSPLPRSRPLHWSWHRFEWNDLGPCR